MGNRFQRAVIRTPGSAVLAVMPRTKNGTDVPLAGTVTFMVAPPAPLAVLENRIAPPPGKAV
jgi:hypothetical protein